MQCGVCSVQCAVCSVQCAVCSVRCAVCSVQSEEGEKLMEHESKRNEWKKHNKAVSYSVP